MSGVAGLPNYLEENYANCPLHNLVAFHMMEVRDNEQINEEILNVVENNRRQICTNIREITGVLISNNKLNRVILGKKYPILV